MATRGMTLIELLVAFLAFVLLVGALVSLATAGLDTWTEGEGRKDIYDRAQAILDVVAEDLRNTYAENRWYRFGPDKKQPPAMIADFDKNRRARLRLVRTGHPEDMQVAPERKLDIRVPETEYTKAWEVCFIMDSDADKNVLYRGVRYFDRKTDDSFYDAKKVSKTSGTWFDDRFTVVDDGVLFLGYKFWTQFSDTWDTSKRIRKSSSAGRSRSKRGTSGPSLLWDSPRDGDRKFFLNRRRIFFDDPDFVYPEIVQVHLTLESTYRDIRGVELAEPLEAVTKTIMVSTTKGMPDAPNFLKIGSEWIEYSALFTSSITVKRRGVRGTKAEKHTSGERVRFGRTFVAEVAVPTYREATNP